MDLVTLKGSIYERAQKLHHLKIIVFTPFYNNKEKLLVIIDCSLSIFDEHQLAWRRGAIGVLLPWIQHENTHDTDKVQRPELRTSEET